MNEDAITVESKFYPSSYKLTATLNGEDEYNQGFYDILGVRNEMPSVTRVMRYLGETKLQSVLTNYRIREMSMFYSAYKNHSNKLEYFTYVKFIADSKENINSYLVIYIETFNKRITSTTLTTIENIYGGIEDLTTDDTRYVRKLELYRGCIRDMVSCCTKDTEDVITISYDKDQENKTKINNFYNMIHRTNFALEAISKGKFIDDIASGFSKTTHNKYKSTYEYDNIDDTYKYTGFYYNIDQDYKESLMACITRTLTSRSNVYHDIDKETLENFRSISNIPDYDFREVLFENSKLYSMIDLSDMEILDENVEYSKEFLKEKYIKITELANTKKYYYIQNEGKVYALEVSLAEILRGTPKCYINQYYKLLDVLEDKLYMIEADIESMGLSKDIYSIVAYNNDSSYTQTTRYGEIVDGLIKEEVESHIKPVCELVGVLFN